jgi:hypothetical protein
MHTSLRSRVSSLRIQPFFHTSVINSPLAPRAQQQRQLAGSSMSALLHGDTFFLDNFAVRQWDDPNYSGTRIQYDKAEFVEKVGSSRMAAAAARAVMLLLLARARPAGVGAHSQWFISIHGLFGGKYLMHLIVEHTAAAVS